MRVGRAVLVVGIGLLIGAPPSSATVTPGTAGVPATQASLTSDAAGDTMSLTCTGGMLRYPGPPAVTLPIACADVQDLFITGNGGNDSVDLSSLTPADFPKLTRIVIKLGDTGDSDIVLGSQLADTITADGPDAVTANGGNDDIDGGGTVFAGAGDDLIKNASGSAEGGTGDDRFISPGAGPVGGGPGRDSFELDLPANSPFSGTLKLGVTDQGLNVDNNGTTGTIEYSGMELVKLALIDAGTQIVDASTFSGDVDVDGRGGPDTLIGGPGEDFLTGGSGDDTITGGPGFDYVRGGAGADSLLLRDGGADRGICGTESDSVVGDALDTLTDCESIDLPPAPVAATPTPVAVAPDILAPKLILAKARLKGRLLSFTVSCPAGETRCTGEASLKASGKRGAKKVARTLGRAAFSLAGGTSTTVTKKLGKKQLAALRGVRGGKLGLVVDVADAAGNKARQTASLGLTLPKPKKR